MLSTLWKNFEFCRLQLRELLLANVKPCHRNSIDGLQSRPGISNNPYLNIIFTFVSTVLARYFELATELALLEGRDFLESPEAAGVKGRGDPKTLVFVDAR